MQSEIFKQFGYNTYRVKCWKAKGGNLPAQKVLLWCVELQPNVQSKLHK